MPNVRKPNELHLLEGTARKDRDTQVLVELTDDISTTPTLIDYSNGICRDEIFTKISDFVIHVCGSAEVDKYLLSALVDQYEVYATAKSSLDINGYVIDEWRISPNLKIMNDALDRIHKLMREFGVTPATRSSVKASNQMDRDPMDDVMKGF